MAVKSIQIFCMFNVNIIARSSDQVANLMEEIAMFKKQK